MGRLDLEPAPAHARGTAEEAAGRRARGALSIGVVDAAVTGAHEQAGLREPGHRAAKMSAVHGEDQELRLPMFVHTQVADVDSRECGHPVPRLAKRVIKSLQPGFVDRESVHFVQSNPANLSLAQAEEVAD